MSRKGLVIPRRKIKAVQRKLDEVQVNCSIDGVTETRQVRATLVKYFELFLDGLHRIMLQSCMRDMKQIVTTFFKHLEILATRVAAIVRAL